jgi:hypothetical protein
LASYSEKRSTNAGEIVELAIQSLTIMPITETKHAEKTTHFRRLLKTRKAQEYIATQQEEMGKKKRKGGTMNLMRTRRRANKKMRTRTKVKKIIEICYKGRIFHTHKKDDFSFCKGEVDETFKYNSSGDITRKQAETSEMKHEHTRGKRQIM